MKLNKLTVLSALALGAAFAQADINIYQGPGSFPNDENVLFNQSGLTSTGNPVQGVTNNTGLIVDFLGTEDLTTPSAGQARVEAVDGDFDSFQVYLDNPNGYYSTLILNLNAAASGQVTFTIDQLVGSPFVQTFNVDGPGENFFRIEAVNGQLITRTSLTTTSQLQDIRQIRIGGSAVPEPASCAALALGALGLIRRRRARA